MAITVASASLDTTWVEFGAVDLTAEIANTLSALIDEVGVKLNRGAITSTSTPKDSEVATWLNRAKLELAETKQYTWKRRYVTATLTSNTYRYSMPPDYDGGPISIRDMDNDRLINVISNHVYDTLFPDPSEKSVGNIRVATIKNRELWVAPPPDSNCIVEIDYSRSGDDTGPTTDAAFDWLPQVERFRCVDFALAEAFEMLHNFDKSLYYRTKWERGVGKGRVADGKRKWATSGYRARSIFQAR